MRLTLLLLCCLVGVSQSFMFWGASNRQEAEEGIDPTCVSRAGLGDCGFYTCFDQRHPCTRHNWALSYGWRYCARFNNHITRFTQEAQNWINGTRLCTMRHLLTYYNQQHIDCETVEHDMKHKHAECEKQHGVCDAEMINHNREPLMDVYKISRRGAVRFLHYLKQCGVTQLEDAMDWVVNQGGHVSSALDKILDFFD